MTESTISSMLCVDTNVILRLLLGGPFAEQVDEMWYQWQIKGMRLVAPPLFKYELTSVLRNQVFLQQISPEAGHTALTQALKLNIRYKKLPNLHQLAFAIAEKYRLPTAYDAYFLATAQHCNCEFWTLDQRLYNSVHSQLPWVRTVTAGKL